MEKILTDIDIRYVEATDLSSDVYDDWIKWWSIQTKSNEHTLPLEEAEIRNNMIYAVFALVGSQIIGAAGLMSFLNNGVIEDLFYNAEPAIEFRANCVEKIFQDMKLGIGTKQHAMRIEYVDKHKLHSIMITKEKKIIHISERFGWKHIDLVAEAHFLAAKIRHCTCHHDKTKKFIGRRCPVCPYFEKNIFIREYQTT
jgi:hypothetical protein